MLKRNLQRIAVLLLLAAAWQSCSKDNGIQPKKISLQTETAAAPTDPPLPPPPPPPPGGDTGGDAGGGVGGIIPARPF